MFTRHEAVVTALGSSGDGIVTLDGRTVFVPGTLPGELIRFAIGPDGKPDEAEVLTPSPARVEPPCPLFGDCGGCSLQTMRPDALLDWKTQRVLDALTHAGFRELPPPAAVQSPPRSRRRLDLGVRRVAGGIEIGLHRRNGPPVDMTTCEVAEPALVTVIELLRVALRSIGALSGSGSVRINLLDSGPDIVLSTPAPLSSSDRQKLGSFAGAESIARIAWHPEGRAAETEVVAQTAPVRQAFGPITVSPPPGAFLQATQSGETAIAEAVVSSLPRLSRRETILELYAGCGTLTGPLSAHGRVIAYEGSAAAVGALRSAKSGHRYDTETRDLTRQPMLAADISRSRVVVLDPPFVGAGSQMGEIARSTIRDVTLVSCNPVALTRDARQLALAGFSVLSITVIDQFLWSADVECVVAFTRDAKRLARSRA